jgi:hypothetical protein
MSSQRTYKEKYKKNYKERGEGLYEEIKRGKKVRKK